MATLKCFKFKFSAQLPNRRDICKQEAADNQIKRWAELCHDFTLNDWGRYFCLIA